MLAALAVFTAGIVLVVFGFMRSSDVYQHALERASSNEAVVEALGEPIGPGWYLTGSIDVQGASGRADVSIPIAGPRGEGTIFAPDAGTTRSSRSKSRVAGSTST